MKRIGNIYSQIYDLENIRLAHKMASKDKSHYMEIIKVNENEEKYIQKVHDIIKNKTYFIDKNSYDIKIINDKGKERELAKLSYYPHRIVQWAIMLIIERTFSSVFCNHSCASVPNRGIDKAAELLFNYLDRHPKETKYCLKIDVKKFYPSIDRTILKEMIRLKFKDKDLLWLLDLIIDSCPHETGVPIGSYMSQYLANFYLAYFDHWMKEELKLKYVVRYMDDIIILGDNKEELHRIRKLIGSYLEHKLKLKLKENWQVFPVNSRGVDFVGFRFYHGFIKVRKRNKLALIKKVKKMIWKHNNGKMISYHEFCSINARVGFFQYFDHFHLFKKYINPLFNILYLFYRHNVKAVNDYQADRKADKYLKKLKDKLYKQRFIPYRIRKMNRNKLLSNEKDVKDLLNRINKDENVYQENGF